jgi:serine/threonine protein kinase
MLAKDAFYIRHAAPELPDQGSSIATDIWAMGCTLYRLLTREYPFAGPEDAANGRLADPHRLNPQIPLPLTRIVRRALAVDPADRYSDALSMGTALVSCRITNAWQPVEDDQARETWESETSDGFYRLQVLERRKGYEVLAKLDRGRGLRKVFRQVEPRWSDALRVRRRVLVEVVQGYRP